jgi:hypothetical protein
MDQLSASSLTATAGLSSATVQNSNRRLVVKAVRAMAGPTHS